MREKINNNPTVQVALVAVLAVAAIFLFLTRMGGSEEETPPPAAAGAAAAPAPATATAPAAPAAVTTTTSPVAGAPNVPIPRLPAKVDKALDSGGTVVLLVVRGGGLGDRLVAATVHGLQALSNVSVFVTQAEHIARYSAITMGVDVDRVPALVVVKPRDVTGSGPARATVIYGFQSPDAIVQEVRDATYEGPPGTYEPN